jgi:hypothetical protein
MQKRYGTSMTLHSFLLGALGSGRLLVGGLLVGGLLVGPIACGGAGAEPETAADEGGDDAPKD